MNLNQDAHGKETISNRKAVLSLVDSFSESLYSPLIESIYVDFLDIFGQEYCGLEMDLSSSHSPINISQEIGSRRGE